MGENRINGFRDLLLAVSFVLVVFIGIILWNWNLLTAYFTKYEHSEELVLISKYAIISVEMFFLLFVITGVVWLIHGEFLKRKVSDLSKGVKS